MRCVAAACLLFLSCTPLSGVELILEYPALQRIVGKQLFTQDGRRYVRGSKDERCNYAYLEDPKIGAWQDKLRIEAKFSGRTAANLFGLCLGLGDDFPVSITAAPYFHDGLIGFRQVNVESPGRDGFYIRRVCQAMAQSLSTDFQYPIQEDTRRMLEEKRPGALYSQRLREFRVNSIRLTPAGLVLSLDFSLVVR